MISGLTKKKVLFVQLPMPQFAFHKTWGNIPLAAGYLKSAAIKAGLAKTHDISILDTKTCCTGSDSLLIRHLVAQKPDILCFTLYYWNGLRSVYVGAQVKRHLPETMIFVGGPEVTLDSSYLFAGDTVDLGCQGQGEKTFIYVLHTLLEGNAIHSVPGVIYRDGDRLKGNPEARPFTDPEDIPSPYLSGIIDPKDYARAWIETQRGCAFKCKFCTWKIRSPLIFPKERILDELRFIKSRGIELVKVLNGSFVLDPNFEAFCEGILKIDPDRQMSFIVYIPAEQIDIKKARLLRKINCVIANVGLQSVHRQALAIVARKFNAERFVRGCRYLMEAGIPLEIDTIVGLPGDTLDGFHQSVAFMQQHGLCRYPNKPLFFLLSMMPGAPLRQQADRYNIEYNPMPPYYIKSTYSMSPADIDAAVKKALNQETYIPTAGSNANTYSMVSRCHAQIRSAAGNYEGLSADTIDAPISKLIAYLDHRIQNPEQWEKLGSDLCNRIQQPFTAWFKTSDIDKNKELVYAFCRCLIEQNPYLIFILIIESTKACALDTIDTLKQNIHAREVIYQTITAQKAMALLYVLPWNSRAQKPDLPSSGFQEFDLIWSIRIHDHLSGWKNELQAAIDEPCSTGVLIDVDDNVSLSERALILQYLFPIYQRTTKMIHFTNLELDTFLTHFNQCHDKYRIITPWHFETILTLDHNFSIQSLYESDQQTYQDLAAYQLFMQKALHSETDPPKLWAPAQSFGQGRGPGQRS